MELQKNMRHAAVWLLTICLLASAAWAKDIVRPEKIRSKRQVVYDLDTYQELARLWKEYNREFPSEEAYANWMYAARYAQSEDFENLLDKGIKKYPANPTLLYLASCRGHGSEDLSATQNYLERSVQFDPEYTDPWFSLVGVYMEQGDDEKTDTALRRLLEAGAIVDEVMDYSYNMLVGLEPNAILLTNGDNDTYPGWILTRLLDHRPDVVIVNRSLLNTEWYPQYIMDRGAPRFITGQQLTDLHKSILNEIKKSGRGIPYGGPFGDTLIVRLIDAAARSGRPVYMSWTMTNTDVVTYYRENGIELGLVTLVTLPAAPYRSLLDRTTDNWLHRFRTGSLDSWRLQHSSEADAARKLMLNYATGIHMLLDSIGVYVPETRIELFHWYRNHLAEILPGSTEDDMNRIWCELGIREIRDWCRTQGYSE